MRSALTNLKDLIDANIQTGAAGAGGADSLPLREHTELRGFLPLEELYEVCCFVLEWDLVFIPI